MTRPLPGTPDGRWRRFYDWTQGADSGTFTRGITTSVLVLDLAHDAPWGTCCDMAGGHWFSTFP